jgi:hypothetical protein
MEPVDETRRWSRSNGFCECQLLALVLYGLVPGTASAGEQPQGADPRRNADPQKAALAHIAAPSLPAPFTFATPPAALPAFSPTEFRPRKQGLLEAAGARSENSVIDTPMLKDTSIARELSGARSQDRVRLLTLWQSRASSLSLQTGKHGAPTLQWSTPWMHRDTESRGLFDRLLPAPHGFSSAFRGSSSRPAGAMLPKPSEPEAP